MKNFSKTFKYMYYVGTIRLRLNLNCIEKPYPIPDKLTNKMWVLTSFLIVYCSNCRYIQPILIVCA